MNFPLRLLPTKPQTTGTCLLSSRGFNPNSAPLLHSSRMGSASPYVSSVTIGHLGEWGMTSTESTPTDLRAEVMSLTLCSSPRPMMWSMTSRGVSEEIASAAPRS